MSFKGQLLKAGISSNGKDVTIFHTDGTFTVKGAFDLGESGTELDLTPASDRALDIHTTCALTAGTIRSVEINQTQTGASYTAIIEALRVNVATAVMTGDWANAIVGVINYTAPGTAGGGMAAAICAEIGLPAQSMGGGTYALFHGYLNVPTSCVLEDSQTHVVTLLRLEAGGGAVGEFDDHGYLLHVVGMTAGSGHLISANTRTLKILVGSTEKYIYLSDTEDDLGAAYGDSITFSNGATITNASANDLSITEATIQLIASTGIKLDGTVTLDGDGTIADTATVMTLTQNTITLAGATKINLDGPVDISGAVVLDTGFTTGISIAADGTTALEVTSAFSGADMILLSGTASDNGIEIAGVCSGAGILLSAANALGIDFGSTNVMLVTGTLTGAAAGTARPGLDFNWNSGTTYGAGGDPILGDNTVEGFLQIGDDTTANQFTGLGSKVGLYISSDIAVADLAQFTLMGGIVSRVTVEKNQATADATICGITSYIRNVGDAATRVFQAQEFAIRGVIYTADDDEALRQTAIHAAIIDLSPTHANAHSQIGVEVTMNVHVDNAGVSVGMLFDSEETTFMRNTALFDVQDDNWTYLFRFRADGTCGGYPAMSTGVAPGGTADGDRAGYLKVEVDSVVRYIQLYDAA